VRFSIRDLLWATLVVAMGLSWWASYWAMDARLYRASEQAWRQRVALEQAKLLLDHPHSAILIPDWKILDEPLVEP
jgi:hypothetical protein